MDDAIVEGIKAFARNTQISAERRIGTLIENACNPKYGEEAREAAKNKPAPSSFILPF
jgi:hypothetical protein